MVEGQVRLQGDRVHGVRRTRGCLRRRREPRDHRRWRQRLPRRRRGRVGREGRTAAERRGAAPPVRRGRPPHDPGALFRAGERAEAGRDAARRRRIRRREPAMSEPAKNFALTGVAGFVAPRHLKAIKDTGNRLVAAVDPHDAVGVLDRYAFDVRFFTEFERFDRHLEKLRRGPEEQRVHYVSICSPNYLHDAHIRLALRVGADVVCEKPLVINPWNLDALQELEHETGQKVNTVLQLRLHPSLIALRERIRSESTHTQHVVCLTYVTTRGAWYDVSWKGSDERSGGIVTNIGIHFFDLLLWLFGGVQDCAVHLRDSRRVGGALEL